MHESRGRPRVSLLQARARTDGRSATTTLATDEKAIVQPPDEGGGKLRALLVEDEHADVELALAALRRAGLDATGDVAQTAQEFTELVRKNSYDVILADYKLPNGNGMESGEVLRREGLDIPVILVSGALGELTAVECIKQGAADYVLKDHLARLPEFGATSHAGKETARRSPAVARGVSPLESGSRTVRLRGLSRSAGT